MPGKGCQVVTMPPTLVPTGDREPLDVRRTLLGNTAMRRNPRRSQRAWQANMGSTG